MEALPGLAIVIISILLFVGLIFLLRLLGAWMLRINEIITLQKEILKEIKKLTNVYK